MNKLPLIFFTLCLIVIKSYGQTDSQKYLGQVPPGNDPAVFAQGIISTINHEHSAPTISPDGKLIYWSAFNKTKSPNQIIYYVQFKSGIWSEPQIATFSGKYSDGGPCFTKDGNRLYFYSLRPLPEDTTELKNDIWYVDKTVSGWSNPKNIGLSELATYNKWVFSPSISGCGNIYFTGTLNNVHGLYKVRINKESFEIPVPLSKRINSNYDDFNWTPFIAQDETYLIFSSKRSDSKAFNDLYISFKQENGEWGDPINMGNKINNGSHVRFPYVTPNLDKPEIPNCKKQNSNKFQFFKIQIPNCTLFRYQKFVFFDIGFCYLLFVICYLLFYAKKHTNIRNKILMASTYFLHEIMERHVMIFIGLMPLLLMN